ncbi:MAG TPA: VWA domain-containing protein [Vicinamibacterales bacterium]
MFAFGGLPENLVSFCALLRRDYGFRIGAGELLDAARALNVIDLSSQQAVRGALRTVLAGTRDDVMAFDKAFDRFFLSGALARQQDAAAVLERKPEGGSEEGTVSTRGGTSGPFEAEFEERATEGTGVMTPLETTAEEASGIIGRASYSPASVDSTQAPEVPAADDEWVAAARALVRRVQLGPARKWRPAQKGRRFDLRRTLRASLQTGGEPLMPRWLARPHRQPRFVVLIDGSRSMNQYAPAALRLVSALARATARVEVFVFSTALRRVTIDLQRASLGTSHRLQPLSHAWGGGTTIGACLSEFVRGYGDRLLSPTTVVIVASDGLDVGEPEMLRSAVQAISRRSGALVWLNPLLETPGYEPTALGMSTAKPFVTTFTSVNDLAGLVRLSRNLRLHA